MIRIAVATTCPHRAQEAKMLAKQLGLDFISEFINAQYDYVLIYMPEYLGLQKCSERKFAPFYIDFLSAKFLYRSKQAGLRNELIARAIGLKPREQAIIIDATAGLGRDSFILATLGFQVIALERSVILHALLQDALSRAMHDARTVNIAQRIQLICIDAIAYLSSLHTQNQPHVVYLDPMFPERQKSASVKKEMVILQNLLGQDTDADILLKAALSCATKRVVVKRPRLAPALNNITPHFFLSGKNSRFDIYLV